jgi:hypothetical protein
VLKLSDEAMEALRSLQLDSTDSEEDAIALAIAIVSGRLAGT